MEKPVIGRGTWIDKVASKIIEREKLLGRDCEILRAESGLGASGIPHVGSLADGARAYGVKLAVETLGRKSEYIAFSDDMDGLRKVPAGLPEDLKKYLGFPVSSIPDPYACHESYGAHMSSLLIDALDRCGISYSFMSAQKCYAQGTFNSEIETILSQAKRVGELIREELGQEKYTEVLPYFPICRECGRIYTTRAQKYLPKESKILYACEGLEIKGKWLEGCGHKGEVDYRKAEGKLSWKVEFAARWRALKIIFEAYGKDIADSVRVNDRICREILGYEPPYHIRYEMFLDKSGKKISKSAGNVLTPQVWLRYSSPQSLLLLMYKRVVGTRALSVTDIPIYMAELDELEDVYFGAKTVDDRREIVKLRGLYEYCWLLKPPARPKMHIPYNLLVFLAKVAPEKREIDYIVEKLRSYNYNIDIVDEDLKQRIQYAVHWSKDFEEIRETRISLNEPQRMAVQELVMTLSQKELDDAGTQNAIYETARKHGIQPKDFFKTLYMILLGAPQGPRLGPYINAFGRKEIASALSRALQEHGDEEPEEDEEA